MAAPEDSGMAHNGRFSADFCRTSQTGRTGRTARTASSDPRSRECDAQILSRLPRIRPKGPNCPKIAESPCLCARTPIFSRTISPGLTQEAGISRTGWTQADFIRIFSRWRRRWRADAWHNTSRSRTAVRNRCPAGSVGLPSRSLCGVSC